MKYVYYSNTPSELYHHGILGQRWGKRNGPPYPLDAGDHSAEEKKAGWRKSLGENIKNAAKNKAKEVITRGGPSRDGINDRPESKKPDWKADEDRVRDRAGKPVYLAGGGSSKNAKGKSIKKDAQKEIDYLEKNRENYKRLGFSDKEINDMINDIKEVGTFKPGLMERSYKAFAPPKTQIALREIEGQPKYEQIRETKKLMRSPTYLKRKLRKKLDFERDSLITEVRKEVHGLGPGLDDVGRKRLDELTQQIKSLEAMSDKEFAKEYIPKG